VFADERRADLAIAYVRLLAVPFALLEAAVEEYPPGDRAWAWTLAGALAVGAVVFLALSRRGGAPGLGPAALVFDVVWLTGWITLYGDEPGSPVRQLLFLAVLEAAIRFGVRGAVLLPPVCIPALVLFEWRQSERVGEGFDVGHAIFPAGLLLLVGAVVGVLVEQARRRPQ